MSNGKFGRTDGRDRIYKMDCPNPKSEKLLAQQNYITKSSKKKKMDHFIKVSATFCKEISENYWYNCYERML